MFGGPGKMFSSPRKNVWWSEKNVAIPPNAKKLLKVTTDYLRWNIYHSYTLYQDEDEADQSVLKGKSLESDKASATYSNQVSTAPMFQSFLSVGQPLA